MGNEGSLSILVIEAEEAVSRLVARALRNGGHLPMLAITPDAAITLARSSPPDLILCDPAMPGRFVADVIDALKADPATRDVPLILTCGSAVDDRRCDAFLPKPFTGRILLELIDSIARKHP